MSDESDDLEELDVTAEGQKKLGGTDSSHRQTIMRQLLNELLITNNWLEQERNHPFSSLEVIIEEVTPSPSSQQLENNLSTIKAGLRSRDDDFDQESAIDSDEEDTRRKFTQNENSLKQDKNMHSFKSHEKSDQFYIDDSSSMSTGRTFNDSNTSNIDIEFDSKESTCNNRTGECKSSKEKHKCRHKNKTSTHNADMYSKFDKFINDDERYVRKDKPKRRNKFLTLNHNYERHRNAKYKRKYCSATTLSHSDEAFSFWGKRPNIPKKEPIIDDKFCGNVSFTCLNSYSVKQKPLVQFAVPPAAERKKYCGEFDFKCHNKYTVKNPPIEENVTVDELEHRLRYFENQYYNLQEELNKARDAQLTLMQGNEVSSSEEEVHWCSASNKTFNLDRGDDKSMDDFNNSIDKRSKLGRSDSSPSNSLNSFKDNKSLEAYSDTDRTEYKDIIDKDDENQPSYSGNIFVGQKLSKDSGLQTHSASNSRDNDESIHEEYPKIMYASVNKNVATQVTDNDWIRICTTKKEMSTRGCLKLSLPNSSDDEILDDVKTTERKVAFKTKTIIIQDYSDYSDISDISKKSTSIADTTQTDLPDRNCFCFSCNRFISFFNRFRR